MASNQEVKEMLVKMENVLEQAIALKERNKELEIKLAIYEDADNELDQDLNDFRNKLEYFTSLRDETSIEHKIAELED